ncbi:MAG: hypothetical protein JPMHGGIA_01619 [Saprospiraceae bacterium]|jgi:hypothetical protein|nr:hypothetical protein [Saprospiraceae bacterium]
MPDKTHFAGLAGDLSEQTIILSFIAMVWFLNLNLHFR